jgi:hypothetical protein
MTSEGLPACGGHGSPAIALPLTLFYPIEVISIQGWEISTTFAQ